MSRYFHNVFVSVDQLANTLLAGYLVGTLDRFNNAKRAEVRDRVKHMHA